jgi:uncharacterized protein YaiL (DUF2058 family)
MFDYCHQIPPNTSITGGRQSRANFSASIGAVTALSVKEQTHRSAKECEKTKAKRRREVTAQALGDRRIRVAIEHIQWRLTLEVQTIHFKKI